MENRNLFINSLNIEYGRIKNDASYCFIRIPAYDLDGKKIVPKVALTNNKSALEFARENNTGLVINASLFNTKTLKAEGVLIIDGVDKTTYKNSSIYWMLDDMGVKISNKECYPLLIDNNNTLSCLSTDRKNKEYNPKNLIAAKYKYAVTGWGALIQDFKKTTLYRDEIVHPIKYIRQVIGQFQNGDYFVMSVDKIGYTGITAPTDNEKGVKYKVLTKFLLKKGVKFAYSLDGGGSCETVVGNRQINPIYDNELGRKIPTVIYFDYDT